MKAEPPIDAHLRQALAHAPDAELSAPAHVSAQIIAAAHRAVGEAAPQAAVPALPAWRRWLQHRPARWGSSGALASLLMAGFLGWMWQGGVPEPQPQPRPQPHQPAPAAAAEPVPLAAPAAVLPAPAAPEPQAARAADASRRSAELRQQRDNLARQAQRESAEQKRRAEAAPLVVPPPPSPPPSPPPPQPIAAARATTPPADTLTDAQAPAESSRPLALHRAVPAAVVAALAPLPPLQPPPQAQRWQLEGGASQPAQPAWLQHLARRTQGRWLEAASAPPAGTSLLRLMGDNLATTTLWLGTDTLWWCNDQMRCLQATPGEEALVALKKELPR